MRAYLKVHVHPKTGYNQKGKQSHLPREIDTFILQNRAPEKTTPRSSATPKTENVKKGTKKNKIPRIAEPEKVRNVGNCKRSRFDTFILQNCAPQKTTPRSSATPKTENGKKGKQKPTIPELPILENIWSTFSPILGGTP